MADLERGDPHLPTCLLACPSYTSASKKAPPLSLSLYIMHLKGIFFFFSFFLLNIHDTRYPVLLPLRPTWKWEIYVYYVRTLTLLEPAIIMVTRFLALFIMGYSYTGSGVWDLLFAVHRNFLFLFVCKNGCVGESSFVIWSIGWSFWLFGHLNGNINLNLSLVAHAMTYATPIKSN